MAACLQARGCLRIYCVYVCVYMTRGGTQHHWCGHRAKVHSEMCGLGSIGGMASVNGEGRVSTSTFVLSSFSRLLCHLHFSLWHAWRPPPFSQVTEAGWRWRKREQKSRTTEYEWLGGLHLKSVANLSKNILGKLDEWLWASVLMV